MQNGMLVPDTPVNRMARMAGGAFGVDDGAAAGITISVAPARKLYAGDAGQSFAEPDFKLVGQGGEHLAEMEVEAGTVVYLYADKVMTAFSASVDDDPSEYSGAVIGFEYSTDGGATYRQVRWKPSDGDNFVTVESDTIVRAIQVGRVNSVSCSATTTWMDYCTYNAQMQLADDSEGVFAESVSVDGSEDCALLVFSQMMIDVRFNFMEESDYADYTVGDKSGTASFLDQESPALAIGNNWTPPAGYTVCTVEDNGSYITSYRSL